MMKTKLTAIAALLLTVSACDVNKTQSGDLPDVDVDVSADAGELPEYEVNWADIDVGTTTETVSVPKVVIVTEEEEVEVPFIDINMPGDKYDDRQKVRKNLNKIWLVLSVKVGNPLLHGLVSRPGEGAPLLYIRTLYQCKILLNFQTDNACAGNAF